MPLANSEDLFAQFSVTSKEEWLAKVVKDLKGKPLEDLSWQLEDTVTVEPFYHPDDLRDAPMPIVSPERNLSWNIGEYVVVSDAAQSNKEALEGLAGGVEAPLFLLRHELSDKELAKLLEDINVTYISTHFSQLSPDRAPVKLLKQWLELLDERGVDNTTIQGSIDFDPLLDWDKPPLEDLAQGLKICREELPNFQLLQVNARPFHGDVDQTSRELAYTIAKGSEYLAQLSKYDLEPEAILPHLQFSVAVGTSFFVEIAKLRALRLLWQQVVDAYQSGLVATPKIAGHFALESQTKDANQNMIQAATQSMSAVLGGVDTLYVLPANAALREPSTGFTRRIARNVQHLLKMESYFDRVLDPAAGSYYIETLTDKLVEAAWEQFCTIEKAGGFMDFRG